MSPTALPQPVEEGSAVLCFMHEPVFQAEVWEDAGEFVIHVTDLDVAASAASVDEAAQKAGGLIIELLEHLLEEMAAGHATDAERDQLHLLLERLGPPVLREHERHRRADLLHRFREMIGAGRSHDWGVGRASRHGASTQASPA